MKFVLVFCVCMFLACTHILKNEVQVWNNNKNSNFYNEDKIKDAERSDRVYLYETKDQKLIIWIDENKKPIKILEIKKVIGD